MHEKSYCLQQYNNDKAKYIDSKMLINAKMNVSVLVRESIIGTWLGLIINLLLLS